MGGFSADGQRGSEGSCQMPPSCPEDALGSKALACRSQRQELLACLEALVLCQGKQRGTACDDVGTLGRGVEPVAAAHPESEAETLLNQRNRSSWSEQRSWQQDEKAKQSRVKSGLYVA